MIASYYVLFAAMRESVQSVLVESIVMTGFVIAAAVGFKSSAWIVVGGLSGHGVFDGFRGALAFVWPSISAPPPALPG